MASVNFNIAAVSALRNLQSTNTLLDKTQSSISTGLKIESAKDNAAYWSITTSMKSDNKAMAAVSDALGLGAATVDTAYEGVNATIDVLDEIKKKLTLATQSGTDKKAIQAEITELLKQVKAIATSSSFSNENWLSVAATEVKSVVGSFTTDANGNVTIGTVNFDTADSALFVGASGGVMQNAMDHVFENTSTAFTKPTNALTDTAADNRQITLTFTPTGGSAKTVTINASIVQAATGGDATIDNAGEMASAINYALGKAGLASDLQASVSTTNIKFTSQAGFTVSAAFGTSLTGTPALTMGTTAAATKSLMQIDISNAEVIGIQGYIQMVNKTIDRLTTSAANLGAMANRIDLQTEFVTNLMDTIDEGVSGLIDADMNEESTKLQALQVKQQLGVQALSIANQSAQNVLALFQQ